jgi:hypothetical protein
MKVCSGGVNTIWRCIWRNEFNPKQKFPEVCLCIEIIVLNHSHSSGAHLQNKNLQTYAHLQIHLYGIVFIHPEHISETIVSRHIHTSRVICIELYSFL